MPSTKMEYLKKWAFLGAWMALANAFPAAAQITAVPTFVSCGIYLPSVKHEHCTFRFKAEGDHVWTEAFEPIYDTLRKEYRTSLVRLREQTRYLVSAEFRDQGKTSEVDTVSFMTWTSQPVIAKTIPISEFMVSGHVEIRNISGSELGWIRITGDSAVDAGQEHPHAVELSNCHYVIIEGAAIKGGYKNGLYAEQTSDHIRIINCDVSHWGRPAVTQNEKGVYLDLNGASLNSSAGIKLENPLDAVIERCYVHDPNGRTNPWAGIIELGPFKGQTYKATHPEGPNAVNIRNARGGVVVRYCDLVGSQTHRYDDPFETSDNGGVDGGLNKDADVYGNMMGFAQDDGIELDGGQSNVRMFDNRIEQTFTGISTAPNKKGPSFIFNNLVWNLGNSNGHATVGVKNGGGTDHSLGRQFFIHNTILSPGPVLAGVGFGNNQDRALFHGYSRNNIFLTTGSPGAEAQEQPLPSTRVIDDKAVSVLNSFDYDELGNSRLPGEKAIVLAVAGSEDHAVWSLPEFTDPDKGIFTLKASDRGIDRGQIVANFSRSYNGSLPDMGAFELGTSTLSPVRPVGMQADRYFLCLLPGKTETVTITTGNIGGKHAYRIHKAEDMEWLSVEKVSGSIQDNKKLVFRLTAKAAEGVQKGVVFFRLDNGFSIPVTIMVKQ